MIPIATVQLFGALKLEVDGKPVTFKTRPIEQLFARLLIQPDEQIERSSLIDDIWPVVPLPSSSNRLRTTLVMLKHDLEPWEPIEAGRNHVLARSDRAFVDLLEARSLLKKTRLLWDREEERECLQRFLSLVKNDLLDGWTNAWTIQPREVWRNHRIGALLRLTQLAIDLGDLDEVISLTESTLELAPHDPVTWGHYLRTMAKQGAGQVAVDRFREARKALKARGEDFSSEVIALAKHVHGGGIKAEHQKRSLTVPEQEIVASTVERAFISDPSLALAIIASPAFRAEVFRRPREAFRFAAEALDNSREDDPNRVKAMWAVLWAGLSVNDHERTQSICQWLIANTDESSQDHRFAALQLGFMNFERRNWPEAHRWTNLAKDLAAKHGGTYDQAVCQVQVASLAWHEGYFDQAEQGYLEAMVQFEGLETIRDIHNFAAIQLNLGIVRVMQFDFVGSEAWGTKAWRLACAQGLETVRLFSLPLLGLCKAMRGDPAEGHNMIIEGVTMTYRNRAIRFHEIAMDFAAAALAHAGHGSEAVGLLDAYARLRAERSHARSVAEQGLADWIRKQANDAQPARAWASEPDIRVLIERSCALLESA